MNQQPRTILILLILLCGFHFSAMAEGLWGAKASLDINAPGKWHAGDTSFKNYHSGLGFSAGALYSWYFGENLFLEPSLSIFYDTYSEDVIIDEGYFSESNPTVYKVGLRLPVVIGYTFDITDSFAISVFTGPELNYAFAGNHRFKDKNLNQDNYWGIFGDDGFQRRFTCAWKGGVGFPFSDWRVDFEAAIGLSDMIKGPVSCRENRFSLSLLRYF